MLITQFISLLEYHLSVQHHKHISRILHEWSLNMKQVLIPVVCEHSIKNHKRLSQRSVITYKINIKCGCKYITKTCLYNFDPLKPHFYTVKLGLQGYILFFLFLLKNIDCGYSLEPPPPIIYDLSRNMKTIRTFIWKFSFFGGKIFIIGVFS